MTKLTIHQQIELLNKQKGLLEDKYRVQKILANKEIKSPFSMACSDRYCGSGPVPQDCFFTSNLSEENLKEWNEFKMKCMKKYLSLLNKQIEDNAKQLGIFK